MQVRVVLVEPEHDGNIGSIARIMKNFGFSDLWIVNPKTQIGQEAKTYASHAGDILERLKIASTLKEVFEDCAQVVGTTAISGRRPSNLLRVALTPEEYARISRHKQGRVCLLFGRESSGLTNRELDECDAVITIPTTECYRTMNVASACAIILYELRKHGLDSRKTAEPVDNQTRKRLVGYFSKLAQSVGAPSHRRRLAVRAFRSVLSRGLLSQREALLIMGIIRRACRSKKL
jgi:tRNA/rRNA methyltransferase